MSGASNDQPASELITKRIAELGDWRGKTLGRMRKLIDESAFKALVRQAVALNISKSKPAKKSKSKEN